MPVGTADEVRERIDRTLGERSVNLEFDVVSNPEFLKEGAAINDFQYPDRVVIGVRTKDAEEVLSELYGPFLRTDKPLLVMTPESAELTKYVANALLSTKISFINEMANLCERIGGDINDVRRGIGHDRRIGFAFLFPGVGYGGSCFPKDVRALAHLARQLGMDPLLLDSVDEVNNRQKHVLSHKIEKHFGGHLAGKQFAIWGLAFKPKTDDVREAPAMNIIQDLLDAGANVIATDPEAIPNFKKFFSGQIEYTEDMYDVLDGADALAIITEWNEFRTPDFTQMKSRMKAPVIFDGRNIYDLEDIPAEFYYSSIGREIIQPK